MKNMFNILALSFVFLNITNAQTITMTPDNDSSEVSNGGYYQDTNNSLNQFVGTWVYTGTNETITIKLRKVTHTFSARIYEDLLIGEYSTVREVREKAYEESVKQTNTPAQNELGFLKFIKNQNLGIEIYKANASFSQWSKLSIGSNNNVIETPCL